MVLSELEFHAYHGVLAEEKRLGQKFLVTCSLFCDLKPAAAADSIAHCPVDYAKAHDVVQSVVSAGPTRDLIETVAEDVARALLRHFTGCGKVTVRVDKPHVAVEGRVKSLGVEIKRVRE